MTVAPFGAAVIVAIGLMVYGRWAGWGFGLGWWGRPTPAQIRSVEPLRGALMKGGAPWAMREARHRVRAHLDVHPPTRASYVTTTITWVPSVTSLEGRHVTVRASRTRNGRVWLPRAGAGRTDVDPPGSGAY